MTHVSIEDRILSIDDRFARVNSTRVDVTKSQNCRLCRNGNPHTLPYRVPYLWNDDLAESMFTHAVKPCVGIIGIGIIPQLNTKLEISREREAERNAGIIPSIHPSGN